MAGKTGRVGARGTGAGAEGHAVGVFVSPFGFRLCESPCLLFRFELGVHALLMKSSLRFVGSDVSCQEPLSQARGWPHQRRWPG